MLKKRWREVLIIAVCAVAVVVTAVLYSVFASQRIFSESSSHLSEIYEQLNIRVSAQIENDRNSLKSWEKYIYNTLTIMGGDDSEQSEQRKDEFTDFIEKQQNAMSFSDFYFIKLPTLQEEEEDSEREDLYKYEYICKSPLSDSVETGIRFRRPLRTLLNDDKGGVVGEYTTESGETKLVMLFAVEFAPHKSDNSNSVSDNYVYEDFEFAATGICYDMDLMRKNLSVDVFGKDGEFYITLNDGYVMLQSGGAEKTNYIEFLSHECGISNRKLAEILGDWTPVDRDGSGVLTQKSGTHLFNDKIDGKEKYLTYIPIGFSDWMLVGVVPSSVVNASMSWFRNITIAVMAIIFVFALGAVAFILFMRIRRRQKEQQLEIESRDNLLDLLTLNSNDLYILFSPDTFEADYISSNLTKVLGLDIAEIKKDIRKILDVTTSKYNAFTQDGLNSLPVGDTWETDIQMHHASEDKNYWFHLVLYHSSYNDKDSFIMMLSDRTKENSLNESLEDALEIAKSANEAKSNFLSNMSHDIRTPMNAILGFATLLAKDADKPDKVREYIRKISFSGQHLLSLINDILDMSKIESGKTTLNIEEFSLSEFLEELYTIILPQSKAKNHSFEMYTKGRLPECVFGDKLRLNQVLLNLLSNAIKYTPDGGHIELTVEALGKTVHHHTHLRITVKDDGIGMSSDFVKDIFSPFSRETNSRTKGIQGTGLGMAIAKNIVNLMGGTISVNSELGKGSIFTVELELANANQNMYDDKEFWLHHNVTKVLVVDDEEDICLGVRELMENTGVDIQYALSGKKAIEMVSEAFDSGDGYHIVLLDWKMPDMDGIETAKIIRKKVGPEVPIMVLTSYSFDDIEEDARKAGINLFLSKPFFVSNFRNAVEKLKDGDTSELSEIPKEAQLNGLKVLAAEDNEINAEILLELLDIEGVKCDIASNGEEAYNKFVNSEAGQYDMIFMDVQMPVLNGYDATRKIRASSHPCAKTIPIIAMTANAFDDDVKNALDSGMNAHLAKPIDMDKLKVIIQGLLDGKNE